MAFKDILGEFSLDEAWKHIEWLNKHAPVRNPGADGQRVAAEYFAEKLASYGLEARLDTFSAYRSVPQDANFTLLAPEECEFECVPCGYTLSTSDEGVDVDVAYVGGGATQAYDGKNVRGGAALVEIAKGPSVEEKARIAAHKGASVIIFIGRESPESELIPNAGINSAWGNPTRSTILDVPQLAAIVISHATGKALINMLDAGPVRARVVAKATHDWGPLPQPIGRLKVPSNSTADFLVLGGHFDAWEPGMTDNAAGNALTLELARVFALHRQSLCRDIFVGFWNGHEPGGFEGSTWFADRYWDHLDQHAVAYFNVESVGLLQSSVYMADSTPELSKWHRRIEQKVLGIPTRYRYLGRENEQPFFGLGLSALEGRHHFTDEQLGEWDGAKNGWWWHTKYDTLDKVDRDRFSETGHLYARYVFEMCSEPVLPMDFTSNATRIEKAAAAMQKRAKDRFELDLPTLRFAQAATALLEETTHAREATRIRAINRTLMKLSRLLTPAFETVGGRYTQDRRSHEALNSPIPVVHAMQLLASTTPGDEISHLLYTELLRDRNKLSDALRHATEEIHSLLGG